MSTSLPILKQKGVQPFEPTLGPRRVSMRELFVTPGFAAWASSLPASMPIGKRLVSPAAELNETAAMFVAGDKVVTIMRGIMPTKHGIVRLFTSSFVLVGWPDGYQRLILSVGETIKGSHQKGRLVQMRKEAATERSSLGLSWDGRPFHELFCYQG